MKSHKSNNLHSPRSPLNQRQGSWVQVRLRPGKEKLPRNGHPWIFSGAIEPESLHVLNDPSLLVKVTDWKGTFIGWGWVNPKSQIRIRLVSWTQPESVDPTRETEKLLTEHFLQAFKLRRELGYLDNPQSGCRLVFSESDGLPGIILDKMGSWLVLQLETESADTQRPLMLKVLTQMVQLSEHDPNWMGSIKGIVEKSDGDGRLVEGLKPIHQVLWGDAPPAELVLEHHNLKIYMNPLGQKSGFYWDQQENRKIVGSLARGKRVLDVCSYSGGFALEALAAGAKQVVLVDSSKEALDLSGQNLQANGFTSWELIQQDCFQFLRSLEPGSQEMIIFDPPKLAVSRKVKDRAMAAYKDANLHAIKALAPGGILATFSCSGLVTQEEFEQAVVFAAKDLGRQGRILYRLNQSPCHPVLTTFPESRYLKGLVIQW